MFEFAAAFGIKTKAARNLKNLCAPRCQMLYVQINHVIHLINCIITPDWFCKYAESFTLNYYEFKDPFGSKTVRCFSAFGKNPSVWKESAVVRPFWLRARLALQLNIEIVHWNNSVSRFFSVKSQTVSSLIWREDRDFELNCDRNNKHWEHPSSSVHLNQVESFTYRLKRIC